MRNNKTRLKIYKADVLCLSCGCSPNCVCHVDDGRGGCTKCGECKNEKYPPNSFTYEKQ